MLVSLFVVLVLLGFFFFVGSICFGTLLKGEDQDDKKNIGPSILFILVAGILFAVAAYHSLSITETFCVNQVTQISVAGNLTTNTNAINCTTQRFAFQELAYFFYGMTAICTAFFFYYVLRAFE